MGSCILQKGRSFSFVMLSIPIELQSYLIPMYKESWLVSIEVQIWTQFSTVQLNNTNT